MKIQIVYHSDTGNTKKLAHAISEAVGVPAEEITANPAVRDVDLLFVGGSWRAFSLEPNCKNFLKSLDAGGAKNVALFSTSGFGRGISKFAQKLLKGKGIAIYTEECNKFGREDKKTGQKFPTEQDCLDAKEFAKKAVATLA